MAEINKAIKLADLDDITSKIKNYADGLVEESKTGYDGVTHNTLADRLNSDFDKIQQKANDAAYLEYNDVNITADHTYYGQTKDLSIKGRTIQNLVKNTVNKTITLKANYSTNYSTNLTANKTQAGVVDVSIKGRTLQNLVKPINTSNWNDR